VQEHFNDLVIATYGRGFWILDDLTPLQQMTPQVLASEVHLFPPRAAYRFRNISAPSTPYDDPTIGENPRYGASINYFLKGSASGNVTITIMNQKGETVRTLTGTNRAGINRIHWDLRSEPTREIRLRTSPLYSPWLRVGADGTRSAPGVGSIAILSPPGIYTVKLAAGGREITQPLTVRKDPNTGGTEADIEAQTRALSELCKDLNAAAELVNTAEIVRAQLHMLSNLAGDPSIRKAAEELSQRVADQEMKLVDLRLTGTGQDTVRYGAALLSKINYLAGGLASGDFKPTNQQLEVQKELETLLRSTLVQVEGVLNTDVRNFNEMLRKSNVPNIIGRLP
jgi:hypothetical protein